MQEIKELKNKTNDLKISLVFTPTNLDEKIEEKLVSITDDVKEIYDNQIDSKYVYRELTKLDDRSRCSNVRIYGITDS